MTRAISLDTFLRHSHQQGGQSRDLHSPCGDARQASGEHDAPALRNTMRSITFLALHFSRPNTFPARNREGSGEEAHRLELLATVVVVVGSHAVNVSQPEAAVDLIAGAMKAAK